MTKIGKIQVTEGVYFVEIPDANLQILCGCPADSVKHLMKRGLILTREENGVIFETGPNVVLLSDVLVQNGSFANLAEFPVLQMLYKQGMIIPGHPNNTGIKPMLIGMSEQVEAQMQYIYRGNYGLVSEDEIMEAGIEEKTAAHMMRLKLKFAFGKISPAEELLDTRVVESKPVEIRNNVFIRRLALNVFEFSYKNEAITVNLNLPPDRSYGVPYPLGFHQIHREYFGVIHSGEGDGWNVDHPCMSSILMFQGKIYLIDAGPNVIYSLMSLGIGVNEIEGIFHTHAHDDHFSGFTTLMRSDHRIKYYATPLVRSSVSKKLSTLMSIEEKNLFDYFEVHDLEFDTWNNIDGLEVMPVFSPHPVETSILFFRTLWEDGHKTYAHLADIVALKILKGMVTDNPSENGVTRKYFDLVKSTYLTRVHVKKIDVGGGLIHGDAEDFIEDRSDKIILSHTSSELSPKQKEIGSGAPFGMVDVLIPTAHNYLNTYAVDFLQSYFPTAPICQLNILLNGEIVHFNPESILIRRGTAPGDIFLVLTGNVELIKSDLGVRSTLSAGAMIGEISAILEGMAAIGTYRAVNFVHALRIPITLYMKFLECNKLKDNIKRLLNNREFLQKTWLFGEVVSYPTQNRLAQEMRYITAEKGSVFSRELDSAIYLVKSGALEKFFGGDVFEMLKRGDFFGEEGVLFNTTNTFQIRAAEDSELYKIPGHVLLDIPVVRWKLFETYQKRMKMILRPSSVTLTSLAWKDDYRLGDPRIDEAHKKIFDAGAMVKKSLEEGESAHLLVEQLNRVISAIDAHFADEEAYMAENDYPDIDAHKSRHNLFLAELKKLVEQSKQLNLKIDKNLLDFFNGWTLIEIKTEDKKFVDFLRRNE